MVEDLRDSFGVLRKADMKGHLTSGYMRSFSEGGKGPVGLVSPESENSLAESPLPLGDIEPNLSAGGGQGGRPKRASSGGNSGGARRSVPREVIDLED